MTTQTINCAAETRGFTGCARAINHNGNHINGAEITRYGNGHAADITINGTHKGWAAKAAAALTILAI